MGLEKLNFTTDFEENLFLRRYVKELRVKVGQLNSYIDELEHRQKKYGKTYGELVTAIRKRNETISTLIYDVKESKPFVALKEKLIDKNYIIEKLTEENKRITSMENHCVEHLTESWE